MSEELEGPSIREALEAAVVEHAEPEATEKVVEKVAEKVEPAETAEAKADRVRDEKGKFAKKEELAIVENEHPRPKAPNTWRKEVHAKWEALDPEVQAEVIRREMNIHEGLAKYKPDAEFGQAVRQMTVPFEETFKRLGTDPINAVKELLPTAAALYNGTPEQKAQTIAQICQNFGIDLNSLAQYAPAPIDPNLAQIKQQLNWLQNNFQQQNAQQSMTANASAQQQNDALLQEIQTFAATHPQFDNVRVDMAALIGSGAATTLEDAYAMALWAKREPLQVKAHAAQIAKSKAVSVTGAPTGKTAIPEFETRLDALRYAASQHR